MPRSLPASSKLILDFAPLGVFFLGFKFADMMTATIALIVATALSLAIIYAVERKIAMAPLISGILVAVMGGLTIALNDEQFIKIKPTLLNLLFAAVLLGGVYLGKRGMLKYVLDVAISLTEEGWLKLSRRWGFFFLFLAALNEVIWRSFPTEFWVNFKVFGMFTLTMAFALSQWKLIQRYTLDHS
ncbi:MAG: septation protein A [Azospirillum brasilense]|nr:MAG: septation protein A [Azospirillum brasilense]